MTDTETTLTTYTRFGRSSRIEHWLLVISFFTLSVTGLVQKFALIAISQWFIRTVGGIEVVRIIHRLAATLMMFETIYHLVIVGYRVFVERVRMSMLPGIPDLRAAMQALLYNMGLSEERPLEGRYTFAEKAEYWALIWGTFVMGVTGFMLWNPIVTAKFLPGVAIPAAKAAHGAEGLLAAAAILVWHFYSVHVKLFNTSMFSGKLSEQEMAHEHPLELAERRAGVTGVRATPEEIARRRRNYFPVAAVATFVMLAAVFFFVTYEETALATVTPMEHAQVYAPLPPTPFPTPHPTATPVLPTVATWDGGIGDLFQTACGMCHSSAAPAGGLDVSSYEAVLAGGESGLGIVPGDPHEGTLIDLQAAGGHDGQFGSEELALLHHWAEVGAPEQ